MRTIWRLLVLVVAVIAIGIWLVKPPVSVAESAGDHKEDEAAHTHVHEPAHAHVHVPAPLPYADVHMPPGAWTGISA